MLKRWAILKRAGVGLLGLCLVLVCTLTADASGRQGNRAGARQPGIILWGIPQGATIETASSPAAVPPTVQEFSVGGDGNVDFLATDCGTAANLFCNPGDTCQCAKMTGTATDGVGPFFGGAQALFWLNIDLSHPYNNGNNSGQVCFFASGLLRLNVTPTAQINFITSGAACNGTGGGVALYSGGFTIGASTGGFSQALGGGMIGFGSNFATKLGIFDLRGAGTNLN